MGWKVRGSCFKGRERGRGGQAGNWGETNFQNLQGNLYLYTYKLSCFWNKVLLLLASNIIPLINFYWLPC